MKSPQFALHAEIEEKHWWFLGRRRIVRELIQRAVPASKQETVVDIGCGTGGNIAAFAQDYRCVGMDGSAEAIGWARRRFHGIEFICGSPTLNLGPAAKRATVILLMDVLEHVPDDFLFFSKTLAAVRPGAHLLITVPADPDLWSPHDVSFGHYRRYDMRRLQRIWEGLPVTTRLVSYYNARLYPIVRVIRALNRSKRTASGAAETDFSMPVPPVNALLEKLFAGEARILVDLLEKRRPTGFRRGVSLIALLRREPGTVQPRKRPADIGPDLHDPGQATGGANGEVF